MQKALLAGGVLVEAVVAYLALELKQLATITGRFDYHSAIALALCAVAGLVIIVIGKRA